MRLTLCVFLVLVALSFVAGQRQNCQYSNGATKYDFSSMYNNTQYTYTNTSKASTYYFNICGTAQICTQKANNVDSAACQMSGTSYFDCGHLKTATWQGLPNGVSGAQVTYKDGAACSKSIRQTSLILQCSQAQTTVVSAGEIQPCIYAITINSKLACPTTGTTSTTGVTTTGQTTSAGPTTTSGTTTGGTTSGGDNGHKGGIGGGWIFVIILLCSATVYIVAGIIINYKVRGLQGKELFPNVTFWSDTLPGLLKDGVLFIKGKITGTGGQTGSYQQI
ncbi:hypothetical protein SAMD00019534_123600 [Acytostelium subglobosum LB1]|uniref:hypothetical protein n=1 Tax=Acytostelium subglobosum LB1 TaxID=1410327 RepID=UPI00064490C0|nr:hypothetical protein SAMD00019534_123600 [Acytostelium subglobosum LB1]GAM29184.1 hypothetical protein SAMD00019534_123600 [Acytostelium subglobosum LB1]|eukprot:XP_012747875.1 hypothetical protein SAMD00019534_123600 [Acytostelium subglobosum LB1]